MQNKIKNSLLIERRRMFLEETYAPQKLDVRLATTLPMPEPEDLTKLADAVERQPVVKTGQGEYVREYTPVPDWNWPKFRNGLMWAAVCVLLAGALLAAGNELFQQMRWIN